MNIRHKPTDVDRRVKFIGHQVLWVSDEVDKQGGAADQVRPGQNRVLALSISFDTAQGIGRTGNDSMALDTGRIGDFLQAQLPPAQPRLRALRVGRS